MQESIDCILRRVGRLKASIDRVCDQLIDQLQLDLHNYIRSAFAALETPMTVHRGSPGESVHVAVNNITDGLKAPIETVECLRGSSASGY